MIRLAPAIAAAIALAAQAAPAMEPAPLKLPPTGTTIHYDDGGTPRTWTVVESKPGSLSQARSDGLAEFTSVGGIVTPAHRFRDDRGFEGTQQLVKGDPLQIYPIQVGKNVSFSIAGEAPARGWTWNHEFRCSVTGTERVKLKLGEFDTYVVSCERRSNRGKEATVTRYYAPELALTVRAVTVDHINNNRWSTDIVKLERQ